MDLRVTLLVLILVTGVVSDAPNDGSSSFEKFFDAIIKAVVEKKRSVIEPYHIEDLEITVQPEVHKRKLPPRIKIHAANNTLHGLSTIHRSGPAFVKMNPGTRLTNAQLAAGPLRITSQLTIGFLSLNLRPSVEITVSNFDFTIEILGNKAAQELKTTQFKINELKDLKVKLHQWKWTDGIENRIVNLVLPLLEHKIRTEVEDTVRSHLDDKLQALPEELKKLLYG